MSDDGFKVHPGAICDSISVGEGTMIWGFSHVMEEVTIGVQCNIGEHVFVENGATIGDRVTVKNGVHIWEGTVIEDDVFVGPAVVFTNDRFPRSPRYEAVTERYSGKGWLEPVTVRRGASLGAGSTLVPGVEIGEFAMVAAGAVVTRSVRPHVLVRGCPAEECGYACLCGRTLAGETDLQCEECGRRYRLTAEKNLELQAG